ncbi:hypothetical protein GGX14DRAFT_561965 [Mycena pura]|uniref:Uncharacterized protein n=1 Tax=Mycena pura TaxID=153505 RepID=A0AAD6YIL1_9AGAR|nr:hypothetical protein GGX14DRAFT_561965 [Mycena pura]
MLALAATDERFDKGTPLARDRPSRASAPARIAAHLQNSTDIHPLPRVLPTPRSAALPDLSRRRRTVGARDGRDTLLQEEPSFVGF